jgi:hypothetical protein
VPSLGAADRLAEAATKHSVVLQGPLVALVESLEPAAGSRSLEEIEALARLEETARLIEARAAHAPHGIGRRASEQPGPPKLAST